MRHFSRKRIRCTHRRVDKICCLFGDIVADDDTAISATGRDSFIKERRSPYFTQLTLDSQLQLTLIWRRHTLPVLCEFLANRSLIDSTDVRDPHVKQILHDLLRPFSAIQFVCIDVSVEHNITKARYQSPVEYRLLPQL